MIITKNVTIKDREFIHTYSDQDGYGVECNGIIYQEAYDLVEYPKEYTEVKLEINEEIIEPEDESSVSNEE